MKREIIWDDKTIEEYEIWCVCEQIRDPDNAWKYTSLLKPIKKLPRLDCTYSVYYIPNHPKDGQPYVGVTQDMNRRMKQHGVKVGDYTILFETTSLLEADLKEKSEQRRLLGKSDNHSYIIQAMKRR